MKSLKDMNLDELKEEFIGTKSGLASLEKYLYEISPADPETLTQIKEKIKQHSVDLNTIAYMIADRVCEIDQ